MFYPRIWCDKCGAVKQSTLNEKTGRLECVECKEEIVEQKRQEINFEILREDKQ